jgi:hypothetical protein|tara:strand:+ start:1466 stop:1660 length:195 start_codon:yes stop_codon:yes gene_type:complete
MNIIVIFVKNTIYKLRKQPFESDSDAYERLWWMINHTKDFNNSKDISDSIKVVNIKKGMSYYNK